MSGVDGKSTHLPANDRGFQCSCCKRKLVYEAKYQCIICLEVAVCKLCFGVKYHPQHQFLVRPSPEKDWQPAFRESPVKMTAEYKALTSELKDRELLPEDHLKLLQMDERAAKNMTRNKWVAIAFEQAYPSPESYFEIPTVYCSFCREKIADKKLGL